MTGLAVTASLPAYAQLSGSGSLPDYCSLSGKTLDKVELFSTSGDRNLDRALIFELKKIIEIIPISPGFKYIRDDSPNAFATRKTFVEHTRGTVLLGMNLIRKEAYESAHGGVAVAGICAHECAHIYQFFSPFAENLASKTSKYVELHADLIAGYYMGRRRDFAVDRIAIFARSIFNKGDYKYNNKEHHGTPEQRFEATKRGYELGTSGMAFGEAAEEGAAFVWNL